jgi:hypothetical protein
MEQLIMQVGLPYMLEARSHLQLTEVMGDNKVDQL